MTSIVGLNGPNGECIEDGTIPVHTRWCKTHGRAFQHCFEAAQDREIERLRSAITTTLAAAPCAHLADDHGHQRCDTLAAEHDGRRHPYTRPRMLDALAAAIEA